MVTPTDLANLVRCRHRTFLDAAGDPAEKLPASAFMELLWENGLLHEERIIAGLGAVDAKVAEDPRARIEATKQLMAAGTPLIYHGYLEANDLRGEPDLLEKVDHPSALGAFAYIPIDIKNAQVFEKRTGAPPKERFLLQLSAYAELLDAAQGWWPAIGKTLDGEGVMHTLDLMQYRPRYEDQRRLLTRIRSHDEKTVPGWKGECSGCQWQDVCLRTLNAIDDVTLVAGIGESGRSKLACIGVTTAAELAAADPATLQTVKGIGPSFSAAWVRQANAQKRGTPEFLDTWVPPAVDFEVSYDIEDFSPDPFLYLHGLLVRPSTAKRFGETGFTERDWGTFEPVCATLPDDTEETVWRRFLETVAALERRGTYAVYVYSPHETTYLKKLKATYGTTPDLDRFIERIVDLLPVVRRCAVFPVDSNGLKGLARYVGFDWRDADPGGVQSMVWWADYTADPVRNAELRNRVIAYNEDDVRATFALRDWLERALREHASDQQAP